MTTVREIMTAQLFHVFPEDDAAEALDYLRILNIHAAPVLEHERGRAVGMVSQSDLTGDLTGVHVESRMNSPAIFVLASATLKDAARVIAESGFHHVLVVDAEQHGVGFLSAIDIIRAQLGWHRPGGGAGEEEPAPGPWAQLEWTDEEKLTETGLLAAPGNAGLLLLQRDMPDGSKHVVWAESCAHVRDRLLELWQEPPARIARLLERGSLTFRAAEAPLAATRRQVLAELLRRSAAVVPAP